MTERSSPQSEGRADDGLDALIGDLEAEAARRRAEPAFPVDAEARLSVELDRQAPDAAGAPLDELLGGMVDAVARLVEASAPGARPTRKQSRERMADELSALAMSVSAAVLALARRIEHLELQQAQRRHIEDGAPPPSSPPA